MTADNATSGPSEATSGLAPDPSRPGLGGFGVAPSIEPGRGDDDGPAGDDAVGDDREAVGSTAPADASSVRTAPAGPAEEPAPRNGPLNPA